MSATPIAREVVIVNPQGLHARPAHQVVKTAMQFRSQVARIVVAEKIDDAKSILDLLTLGAGNGTNQGWKLRAMTPRKRSTHLLNSSNMVLGNSNPKRKSKFPNGRYSPTQAFFETDQEQPKLSQPGAIEVPLNKAEDNTTI
ncbi:MAG: HPr family phosphocarrier protein [Pirellulales bacterium]